MQAKCPRCKLEFIIPTPIPSAPPSAELIQHQSKAGRSRWRNVTPEQRIEWAKKGWIKRKAHTTAPIAQAKEEV